jgi:hypothetical protein
MSSVSAHAPTVLRIVGVVQKSTFLLAPASVTVVRTQGVQHASHASSNGPLPDAVRQATDRYRDVNEAIAAGYVQLQGCVSGPDRGAMGVHYAKFDLFDGAIDVEHPEVLVYEPRNGRLHLVAAEYVTPAPAWDPGHDPFDKPQLMGHLLQFAPGPNRYGPDAIYELHVGLAAQPKRYVCRLEPARIVRAVGWPIVGGNADRLYPSLRSASIGAILNARSVGTVQAVSDTSSMTDAPSTDAIATAAGREPPEPVSSRNS